MSAPVVPTEADTLFKLPLDEFTSARNALAVELKKAGKQAEASATKALAKPSVSAWVVNQLYWRHRGLFDRLVDTGDRMRRAQAAKAPGDSAREAANARRETVTALAKIAEGLLLGADHGATRDLLRRVTTTLDALSSYGSLPGAPSAGRLADDVEPPGFEALAGLPAGGNTGGKKPAGREPAAQPRSPSAASSAKAARAEQRAAERAAHRAEKERNKARAAAEAAVRDAERALKAARKQAERAAARLAAATAESNAAIAAVASAERALDAARRRLQH